jgi:hypothetical protein
MNRGRGRSSRVRTTKVVRNFVTRRQLHREQSGFSPRGRFDPPSVVSNPWNSVVLVSRGLTASAAACFTNTSVITLLKSQLGLTGLTADLVFRLLRVDFWLDSSGSESPNLGLQPVSFFNKLEGGKVSKAVQWIEDVGTSVRPAHCHYVWPLAEQKVVFASSQSATNLFCFDTKAEKLSFTMHVHVLWRSNDADQVPSFRLGELLTALP